MNSLCRVRPTVGRLVRPETARTSGFKYITMSEIYAVLVLLNIRLSYYTLELYSILNQKCGLQCKQGLFGPCDLVIKQT